MKEQLMEIIVDFICEIGGITNINVSAKNVRELKGGWIEGKIAVHVIDDDAITKLFELKQHGFEIKIVACNPNDPMMSGYMWIYLHKQYYQLINH